MRIEQDIKLDFKDVLIRPKRSTLTSRSEVDISRDYTFLHSQRAYQGIPIIAANMDMTGTFEMARALANELLRGDYTPEKRAADEAIMDREFGRRKDQR